MSTAKKTLTHHLLAVVEPHLASDAVDPLSPKAVAKLLRKLATHVQKMPAKATIAQPTTTALRSTAKHAHRELVRHLMRELKIYDAGAEVAEKAPAKALTKTIKRLAKQVVKQQRKQAKQRSASSVAAGDPVNPNAVSAPAPAPAQPVAARRISAKRPAPQTGASTIGATASSLNRTESQL